MATAFAPAVFGSPAFSQQAFGNGPCPGPGPCGPPGEEPQIKPGSGGSGYDEYFRRQYEEQRIREDDDEIIEIVKILLKQGIL